MALTPEQLRQAVARYRGVDLGPAELAPMDPSLSAPLSVAPVQARPAMLGPETASPAGLAQPVPLAAPAAPAMPIPLADEPLRPLQAPTAAQMRSPRAGLTQALGEMTDSTNAQMQATEQAGQVRSQAAAQKAETIGNAQGEMSQLQADTQATTDETRAASRAAMADYERLLNKAESAENNITYDRRSTAQRVVDIFAMAVAGIGDSLSGFSGQKTDAVGKMQADIQGQIDRDVEMQRAAASDIRKQAASKLTLFGMARELLGDDLSAAKFTEGMIKDRYALELEKKAAEAESKSAQLAGREAAAGLRAQSAGTLADVYRSLELARISASRGPSMAISPELQYRQYRDSLEDSRRPEVIASEPGAQLSGDLTVENPDVAKVHAKNAEKIQGTIDAAKNALATIDLAIQMRADNKVARVIPGTDANAALGNLQGDLDISLKTIQELGVLAGPDMALIRGQTGDTTGVWGSNDVKLKQLRENIARKVGMAVTSRGFANPFGEAPAPEQPRSSANRGTERIKRAVNNGGSSQKPKAQETPARKPDAVGGSDW
jgi:hypothetical protein